MLLWICRFLLLCIRYIHEDIPTGTLMHWALTSSYLSMDHKNYVMWLPLFVRKWTTLLSIFLGYKKRQAILYVSRWKIWFYIFARTFFSGVERRWMYEYNFQVHCTVLFFAVTLKNKSMCNKRGVFTHYCHHFKCSFQCFMVGWPTKLAWIYYCLMLEIRNSSNVVFISASSKMRQIGHMNIWPLLTCTIIRLGNELSPRQSRLAGNL